MTSERDADLIVVGGGPAGMMAGLLFARAGCNVRVLEKHADFFRDFRGDTVHPSTMEILQQLGMLERFLQRPHNRLYEARGRIADREVTIGDFRHLNTPAPFIAIMPQWDFLDFLRDEAAAFPGFRLDMKSEVQEFVEGEGRVIGVKIAARDELRAELTIAADGRSSLVRRLNVLAVEALGAPMDIFWFRLTKADNPGEQLRGSVSSGRMVVLIDRQTYWQCGFVIPKGEAERVKSRGVEWIRGEVQKAFPDISLPSDSVTRIEDLHLLEVALDRLVCWHRPGLLAIGDAAHAMSPIGGIGINLAIQDAVAAANILAGPLAKGERVDGLLHEVQQRRLLPTRLIQAGQRAAQDAVVRRVLGGAPITGVPWPVRLLNRFSILRRIPGRMIGLGIRRERVRSPAAPSPKTP